MPLTKTNAIGNIGTNLTLPEWHGIGVRLRAQTERLVHDIFILSMKNLAVQEKLCTELKTNPKDTLECAIAYEEGTLRQKSYGENKVTMKSEPICTVPKRKDCVRCGMKNFSLEHLKVCPAKVKKCNKCGVMGHYGKVCRKPQNQQSTHKQPPRRVNWVAEESEKDEDNHEEEQYVLGIDGSGSPPFMMKGKINRKKFCLMKDSTSPLQSFTMKNYNTSSFAHYQRTRNT